MVAGEQCKTGALINNTREQAQMTESKPVFSLHVKRKENKGKRQLCVGGVPTTHDLKLLNQTI